MWASEASLTCVKGLTKPKQRREREREEEEEEKDRPKERERRAGDIGLLQLVMSWKLSVVTHACVSDETDATSQIEMATRAIENNSRQPSSSSANIFERNEAVRKNAVGPQGRQRSLDDS